MANMNRVTGCLVGKCIADAMGAPVEGCTPAQAAEWADLFREFGPKRVIEETGIGQYTDDSQLARELMISVVHCGRFEPAHYAARVADLRARGRITGIGAATDQAAQRLSAGVPWDRSGQPSPAAGNGTAMRAAPAGFLSPNDPDTRDRFAHEQGLCTHRDPRCSAGSVGVAAAVAYLDATRPGEPLDPQDFCEAVAERMVPWDSGFAELVRALPGVLALSDAASLERITHAGEIQTEVAVQQEIWHGISPFVVPTLLWSFRCLLVHPDDYLAGVLATIGGGGDADSTAAITGALLGVRLGVEGIPSPLATMIHDEGEWQLSELMDLATRFCIAINLA